MTVAETAPDRRRAKTRPEPVVRRVVRRDVEGNERGEVELAPALFGIEPNPDVLHQVVTAQLAAARAGTQSTRTRAEARGGGAKPYRQKGTGRARQGSLRAPQYAGGGIALGPKPRSYRQRTPKKMVRLALCSALSDRAASGLIALVDRWAWPEPKTKSAVAALAALGLDGRVLVVLSPDDVVAQRSFGNLPQVETTLVGELAAYDVLRTDWVVFTDQALDRLVHGPQAADRATEVQDEAADEAAGGEETVADEDPEVETTARAEDTAEADDTDTEEA